MSVWIKICGLTDASAVDAALEAGANAIGFVFAESPRAIEPDRARELAEPARGHAEIVAVFRHPGAARFEQVVATFEPDTVQTDVADFESLPAHPSIAAMPVYRDGGRAPGEADAARARRILYEASESGVGARSDWSAARSLARRFDLVLAGGLTPTNVASAIRAVAPFGVDVSSGVERAPGIKDPASINAFVAAARGDA